MSNEKQQEKQYFEPIFSFYQTDSYYEGLGLLENEKQQEKFIKSIEAIVRTSLEYRSYIKYLKTEALLKKCTILDKLPEEILKSISIEMHHFPFTLYDLVQIILVKHLKNNTGFTRLSIANEVMDSHYLNEVGIVPLSVTMHQLAHSDTRILSKKNIFGKYKKFIDKYGIYASEEQKNKIVKLEKISDTLVSNMINNYLEVDKELYKDLDSTDLDKVHLIEVEDNELEDEEDVSIKDFLSASKAESLEKNKKANKGKT